MIPLADQYVRDLEAKIKVQQERIQTLEDTVHVLKGFERRYVEKFDKAEALEITVADKEICIVMLESLLESADKRIKVLEDAVGGPILK